MNKCLNYGKTLTQDFVLQMILLLYKFWSGKMTLFSVDCSIANRAVNRFGEFSPFGEHFQIVGNFWSVSFIFDKKFEPTLANFYGIGQMLIVVNGQQ